MKKFAAAIVAFTALVAFTTTIAFAEPGKPIDGTDVGLDHNPGGGIIARAVTNREGNVTFGNLKPGTYTFVLMDTSTLKVPCRVSVTFGREKLPVSEPISPGKRGAQAFALDRSGRKLTVVVDKIGAQITIHVQSDSNRQPE